MVLAAELGLTLNPKIVSCDERGYSFLVDWSQMHSFHKNRELVRKIIYVGNYTMEDDNTALASYACFNIMPYGSRDRVVRVAVKI